MDGTPHQIALNAQALPTGEDGGAPEWVHLLPAGSGGTIHTQDGRGPWTVENAARLIETSLNAAGGRIVIDEQHATDLAAPKGLPAPARGWIVAMEERADGIWGRVEWNAAGRQLVGDRAYRAISPVILHDKANRVQVFLRASLVNVPNMKGLVALNMESNMDDMAKIAEALGLASSASVDEIMAAIAKRTAKADDEQAVNAALAEIGQKLGLEGEADLAKVLNAIEAAPKPTEMAELHSTVADLTRQLNALAETGKREKAEAYVDGEIAKGRAGLKPSRDRMIALHMRDAEEARAIIEAMPVLDATHTTILPPARDGKVALNATELAVAAQMGMTAEAFAAAKAGDKKEIA